MIRPPLPPPPAKPSYGSRTLLYMDVMNYATSKFFPVKAPHAKLGQAFARVKRFVSAARRANIELTIFIVAVQDTAEAHKKWMSRREREMLKGIQNTPQGIRTLLVDAFEACQVPVVCSLTHDADDCIAGYANKYGASILSQDNDYFRYRNASESYKVYKDTQVVDGKMILIEHTGDAKNNKTRGIKERDFLDPLPP